MKYGLLYAVLFSVSLIAVEKKPTKIAEPTVGQIHYLPAGLSTAATVPCDAFNITLNTTLPCVGQSNGVLEITQVTIEGCDTPIFITLNGKNTQVICNVPSSGCPIAGQPAVFTGLGAGINLLNIGTFCEDSLFICNLPLFLIASNPAPSIETPACDGTLNVFNAFGGTAPYQVSINGTDFFMVPHTFTGLPGGTLSLTLQDAGGCSNVYQIPVSGIIMVDVSKEPACLPAGGSITIHNITNGAGTDYTVTLKDSHGNVVAGPSPFTTNQPEGLTFSELAGGTYSITIVDHIGCTASVQRVVCPCPTSKRAKKAAKKNRRLQPSTSNASLQELINA